MKSALRQDRVKDILDRLTRANQEVARRYPGDSVERQPVHTLYGGAHLFKAESAVKLGELARRALAEHAPDAASFGRALGLEGPSELAEAVYARVAGKLQREAVEDFRIDFEDGFGVRPEDEEDQAAIDAGHETAKGLAAGTLPPFLGIRVKSLSEELKGRSVRTLDLYLTALLEKSGGKLPPGFVVTLPKVTVPAQVEAFVALLALAEQGLRLKSGSLRLEIMIETPQAILDESGGSPLPQMAKAGLGRVVAAHLGAYDYTSSCGIVASQQALDHPACDFARSMMKLAFADQPIHLADGATNVLPVGPRESVHRAWALSYRHIRHALRNGFYQGWDLHPAQLPVRYGAVYAFFLEGLAPASARLRGFIEKAAQATRLGSVFDDAATGQGLLNFFIRGLACGALTQDEVAATGLTPSEIQLRSFSKILAGR